MGEARWTRRPEGSNWGDFGPDDQVGRMNLVTREARLRGVREVTEGIAFCLSLPLDYPGGNALVRHRHPPKFHIAERAGRTNYHFEMSHVCGAFSDAICDDAVTLFTQYSTQWDSLAHVGSRFDADGDGEAEIVYYNGFRAGTDIVAPGGVREAGADRLGIENLAVTAVQTRGVLVDLEREHGRTRALISYDDLMRTMDAQGAAVEPGDILCLYTGFADVVLSMERSPDPETLHSSCAVLNGRDARLLNWITDSGIAALCADNFAVEGYPAEPGEGERYAGLPLHEHCLFKLGLHLGELWYFSEVAAWLRGAGRTGFLLTAPPLRLPRAVGSPTTPVATV
ncbi:cyclase family protein [Acuticoccus sp.]|uniref:cyclase family protein n=1 Tax=Acuticoccus sp. TaxID=1904378 RepID=UPI003B52C85D